VLPTLLLLALAFNYPWLPHPSADDTLAARIPEPPGYVREPAPANSFAHWLRHLPLQPEGTPVRLHTGALKSRQDVHAAVLDLDVGTRDLQQCADTVMRLRAEYLYARGRLADLHFRFTSGHEVSFTSWAAGERPRVAGRQVHWEQGGRTGTDHPNLRAWLDTVFTYSGTQSLARELRPVDVAQLRAGDVFIQPGSPGHAVLVVDTAVHSRTGARVFLLAQSYMPAQSVHVLRNLEDAALSPWYALGFGAELRTPEWTFRRTDLRRFE
jgi:hypothetical protein